MVVSINESTIQEIFTNSTTGIARRGIVVEIFHDPNNRHGSTRTKLADLEMKGRAILT